MRRLIARSMSWWVRIFVLTVILALFVDAPVWLDAS